MALASVLLTTMCGDDTASHVQCEQGAFLTQHSTFLDRESLARECEVATVLVRPGLCWCRH